MTLAQFQTASPGPEGRAEARLAELRARYPGVAGRDLLAAMIGREFAGRIALVSSFGAEAAVLLHMVATIDAATPVILLDTGKLFAETLAYRDRLVARLGLADVRSVRPEPARLAALDPSGTLWRADPDRCCHLRKVVPLGRALAGFEAWITGRKGYHGGPRAGLVPLEAAQGRVKVNPLAHWRKRDIDAYLEANGLPRHPLEPLGYPSIGCLPCTAPVADGEDLRAGRWSGRDKTECGIHLPGLSLSADAGVEG